MLVIISSGEEKGWINMLFSSWQTLLRIAIVGPLAYIALVAILRISGKRTLAQLNAFDFVVTVALGSTLATTILNTSIGLADGVLALFILILLQLIVARISTRIEWSGKAIKSEPRLLFHEGRFLESAMKAKRVRREEILQVVRSQGIAAIDEIEFVVLETNGKMSVIPKSSTGVTSALKNIDMG